MSTPAESIKQLRSKILAIFYKGKGSKAACRDIQAIQKSLAKYGHLCRERGWMFSTSEIESQINQLIDKCAPHADVIKYFPVYFEKAMDEWFIKKAEEYSAKARSMENVTATVLTGIIKKAKTRKASGCQQSGDVDEWSKIWKTLTVRRKAEPKPRRHEAEQFELGL